jgi:hypothetical protein
LDGIANSRHRHFLNDMPVVSDAGPALESDRSPGVAAKKV